MIAATIMRCPGCGGAGDTAATGNVRPDGKRVRCMLCEGRGRVALRPVELERQPAGEPALELAPIGGAA